MTRDYAGLIRYLSAPVTFGWTPERVDCVRDVAAAAAAQGRPIRIGHRWTTERGARRVLKRLGGLEGAVDRRLPEVAPAHAMRGDIGLVRAPLPGGGQMELLCIVEGDTLAALHTRRGRVRLPRRALVKAWSLG